jgi:hypothetical protein
MKKLISKLILLLIPFLIISLFILILDPYNYYEFSKNADRDLKSSISIPLNEPLWKLIDYDKKQFENILIGDSRMGSLNEEEISLISKHKYYNLSFSAANCNEIISVLDYIIDKYKLSNIFVGLNLDQYNQANNRDRVEGVIKITGNPFLYFVNTNVLEATYLLSKAKIFKNEVGIKTTPNSNKEDFWKYQIEVTGKRYFLNYIYPQEYFDNLIRIKKKCKEKGITLKIIIFPSHSDLNKLIEKYNLKDSEKKFKSDMISLGDVYDFNFENEITNNYNDFKDPFHFNKNATRRIVNILWGGDSTEINIVKKYSISN